MPRPYVGCSLHPKAKTLANQAHDVKVLSELRRPAMPPTMFCRHSHVWQNCTICVREREIELGHIAPRL
jgi:hypothetical protein